MSSIITKRDADFIIALAREQADAGANMLDVNAGSGMRDETADLAWLVQTVQSAVELPLVLDSSNPEVLVAVYPQCKQRPMFSSLTLDPNSLKVLLPFIKEHKCLLLGMCIGESGVPKNA